MTKVELHLDDDLVKELDKLAEKENRSRKNFCETIVIDKVKREKEKKNLDK